MDYDPILKEVHAMKEQLAREVNYDFRKLCQRLRETEKRYADRLVNLQPRRRLPAPDQVGGQPPTRRRRKTGKPKRTP
jgi:hypothetical protein